jgi:DNA polymerase (family 10)
VTPSALLLTLRQLADFAEIRGASHEAIEWRRLAAGIEHAGADEIPRLADLARANRLADVSNLPPALARRLRDLLLLNDTDRALDNVRSELPWLIRQLLRSGAFDSAEATLLARQGIVTFPDLELALHDDRAIGPLAPVQERLRTAATMLHGARPRVTLGRAAELLDQLILLLAAACPQAAAVVPAGDVRRFEPLVHSLVIVAAASDPVVALESLASAIAVRVLHRTTRRAVVEYQQSEVDIRVSAPDEYGTVLHTATGSRAHVATLRSRQSVRLAAREEDVYAQFGLPLIPPELRHGAGEVEAAAEGRLPELISREHIRGDLHMHTTYSDGRDSLVEMVRTCAGLGYEYIAITDHSERAAASRTLSLDTLERQRDEIARVRTRYPSLTILHGVEVDIMPDGSLDFPDSVLQTLDIVLASLHDPAGHGRAQLTARYLAAIEHPFVNVITHPSNRLVGRDEGYELDFDVIFAAAIRTGTALEIDGAPTHLDLDGLHARDAMRAGVTFTVDSDCHRARLLDRQMRFGVGTARRGWVERGSVLNTRSLADVRAFIAAKRARQR